MPRQGCLPCSFQWLPSILPGYLPAFGQNCPKHQFGTSNTQENRSSKVLKKELVLGALIILTLTFRWPEKVRTLTQP